MRKIFIPLLIYSIAVFNGFSQSNKEIDSLLKLENNIHREIKAKKVELDSIHKKVYDLVKNQTYDELAKYNDRSMYIILESPGVFRVKPDGAAQVILQCKKDDILQLIAFEKGYWCALRNEQFGYISGLYIKENVETNTLKQYFLDNKITTSTIEKSRKAITCRALTESGDKCINLTNKLNGYCSIHQPKTNESTSTTSSWSRSTSVRCSATTQKGTRCKRMTKSPNGKCWQHGGN